MSDNSNAKQEYIDFIFDSVTSSYNERNVPMYLSELGECFLKKFGSPRSILGRGLREFITEHVSGVKIYSDKIIKQKILVYPSEANIETIKSQQDGDVDSIDISRVQNAVTIAFRKSVSDGKSVFIKIKRPINYIIEESGKNISDYIEIEKEFMCSSVSQGKISEIPDVEASELKVKIEKWINKHGISVSDIYFNIGRSDNIGARVSEAQGPFLTGESALARFCNLQQLELRRKIIIPLDIAEYLSRMK